MVNIEKANIENWEHITKYDSCPKCKAKYEEHEDYTEISIKLKCKKCHSTFIYGTSKWFGAFELIYN